MNKKVKVSLKQYINRTLLINVGMTVVIFLLTLTSISTGTYILKKHDIEIGAVSNERLIADRDVIDSVATEKKKQEARDKAAAEATKKYKTDSEVGINASETIQSFFNTVRTAKINKEEELRKASEESSKQLENEQNGISDIKNDISTNNSNFFETGETQTSYSYKFPIPLNSTQLDLLISLSNEELNNLETNISNIVGNTLNLGVEEDKSQAALLTVRGSIDTLNLDNDLSNIIYSLAKSVIKPNRIEDEEYTQQQIDEKVAAVEPVKVLKGEKIVDKNEIITEEKYAILEALGYTQTEKWSSETIFPIIGLSIIIALTQAFVYEYIRLNNKKLWNTTKEKTMLFTMYCIIIFIIRFMTTLPYMLIPISLFGMLIAMLIDLPLAIVLNIVISIIGMIMYDAGVSFLLYFIISGTFACIFTRYTYERNNTIKVAVAIGFVNAIVSFGIGFLFEKSYSEQLLMTSMLSVLNGFVTLVVVLGSLPFWEVAFDAITPLKLLELTNPNQPILKKLIIEAPGTYHHSIIVANLAEMAAMDVGANEALAKAGAYYHDIGKLKYPNYFSENQAGENPHDYLLPLDSAKIIIEHVQAGQAYADEEKLPKVIKDMIAQHHGNTLVKFFYYKAKKDFPDETIKEENYRYPGPIPQFKEAAILMLADTVEAAVRSMFSQGKTIDEINTIVGNLIKDKLDDGQLTDSNLTIKDLDIIQNSFIKVFKGMYHGRVAYPKEAMKSRVPEKKESI